MRNLLKASPEAQVKLIVNAQAVANAVADRNADTDGYTVLCRNSLQNQGIDIPADLEVTAAAVLLIASLQQEGWAYIRA